MLHRNQVGFIRFLVIFSNNFGLLPGLRSHLKAKLTTGAIISVLTVSPAFAVVGGIGGSYNGVIPEAGNILCKNLTTSQEVNIAIVPGARNWDCKEAGLLINPTDEVAMTVDMQGSIRNGLTANTAAGSCQVIHKRFPSLPTGAYWVSKGVLPAVKVYCDMTTAGGGWQVLFRSDDPANWGKTFGVPGIGEWGIDKSGVPVAISQLRFSRVDTGAALTIPITASQIYTCSAVNGTYNWNGSKFNTYNGLHLGIATNTPITKTGYIYVGSPCAHYNRGWGFGHRGWQDDKQGWGWNSVDLGPTVFMISVR